MKSRAKSSASYGTVESELLLLKSDFAEFQDEVAKSLRSRTTGWHRISLRSENGKVTVVQQNHEMSRDLRRLLGEGS